MQVIGYHINEDGLLANHKGEICTEHYLGFLSKDRKDPVTGQNNILVFWHLNQAVAVLLRIFELTPAQLEKLNRSTTVFLAPYTLRYLPNKFFSIKEGSNGTRYENGLFVNFGDVSQYNPELTFSRDDKNAATVVARAREAQKTGQTVYDTLWQLGLNPTSLTSPVRAFEKEVLETLNLPTNDNIPAGAAEMAYECCHGGWLEAFVKGYWGTVYDYDISSAYPAQLARLYDTRYGKWVESNVFQFDCIYGYARGLVTIYPQNKPSVVSPILYGTEAESMFTPTGTWPTTLTAEQIKHIALYDLGKFVIKEGFWLIPANPKAIYEHRPLAKTIETLWRIKEKSTGLPRDVVKRIMSGLWGKLLETRDEYAPGDKKRFGPRFNSVWGAEVESRTRLAVARFIADNELMPLSIAVDGVVSANPAASLDKYNSLISENLGMRYPIGQWRLSSRGPGYIISSGQVALAEKHGYGDFSLDYGWLDQSIGKEPTRPSYAMQKLSPVTLPKAIMQNKPPNLLGRLETIERTIDVAYEIKRAYPRGPATGGDLRGQYNSRPHDISVLNNLLKEAPLVDPEKWH